MMFARLAAWLLLVPCASAAGAQAPPGVDWTRERGLVEAAGAACKAADYAAARAKAAEAVTLLVAHPEAQRDAAWLELLDRAGRSAFEAQDVRTANRSWQVVLEIRTQTLPADQRELQKARLNLAATITALGEPARARILEDQALAVLLRTVPDDDPDLQMARGNLGCTLYALGDIRGARALFEKVLEIHTRTLPADHRELQRVRTNLANTLAALGDLEGARALQEQVVQTYTRTLHPDHPALQSAREGLSNTLADLGDLKGARALLEQVLEVDKRTLSRDDPNLQRVRLNYAATLSDLGDIEGARDIGEQVLEVLSRTRPDDDALLQAARGSLANALDRLGDVKRSRALREQAFEVLARTMPSDHPGLQSARLGLAHALSRCGDLSGARVLQERVLEVYTLSLPDDHAEVQRARLALASTIKELGDLAGARALQERALAIQSRKLPDEHPGLQLARGNLAHTLASLREFVAARALQEKVLEVYSRIRPADHPDVQEARENLAKTLRSMGEIALAREFQEQVLAARTKSLPDEDPALQWARGNLAGTLSMQGDLAGARALFEKVHEVCSRSLPDDYPELQKSRQSLAVTIALETGFAAQAAGARRMSPEAIARSRDRCRSLIDALTRAQVRAARAAILGSPGREAEERCSSMTWTLDMGASFAQGYGVFEPLRTLDAPAFVLAETTRGAALVSAELARKAASAPRYRELRKALQTASSELAALAQRGTSSEEFDRARTKREAAERDLAALARELPGGRLGALDLDLDALAGRLGAQDAALGFRRYARRQVELRVGPGPAGKPEAHDTYVDHLCAFVLGRAQGSAASARPELTLVDLGPLIAIETAARGWRAAIGVGLERGKPAVAAEVDMVLRQGNELRRLVLDPLLPALGAAQHLVVALDDVLHLVPLDALPLADGKGLVGDRWRIETRAALTELLTDAPEPQGTLLLALGGASFNLPPVALTAEDLAPPEAQTPAGVAQLLRGSAWARGFEPLTHSGEEARGIGALYAEIFEGRLEARVLEKRKASRAALEELAPKARFVHIATHGWFAAESIRSWSDAEPLDKQSGLGARAGGEAQVKGMSPMLLCGLALAGANLPEGASGRLPGLVTAEELSTLDLAGCELAVLSACDTNVGERRAGQGVHSLQMALQMAGARSVITSLWKVPDEATKELMLDFYRRLWVEKQPKWRALWEAKQRLREAKDETGKPKYTTRDWAGWVLTGDPD